MSTGKSSSLSHLLAPGAVLAVVMMMVVPLPPLLLDLLLTLDIGLAVVLLLTAVYVRQPVSFSVFPSLLLLLTLIRLSLKVASTRLVLMHGGDGVEAAGHVIMAFGQFVVGGNFVVGVVDLPRPDRHPVRRHQPRRGAHLGSDRALHPRRDARQADGDRRRPECRHSSTSAKRVDAASASAAKPTSTARWTARSASRSATRWPQS